MEGDTVPRFAPMDCTRIEVTKATHKSGGQRRTQEEQEEERSNAFLSNRFHVPSFLGEIDLYTRRCRRKWDSVLRLMKQTAKMQPNLPIIT